jgi:hypothetical protein
MEIYALIRIKIGIGAHGHGQIVRICFREKGFGQLKARKQGFLDHRMLRFGGGRVVPAQGVTPLGQYVSHRVKAEEEEGHDADEGFLPEFHRGASNRYPSL